MKKTTLKEIASTLGISISTVSKALKNYPDVSQKTKSKVLELVESLNYTPNVFAQSLRGQSSKTIGVIIPTMAHYFFSRIIDAILKEAEKRDFIVIIMQSNENYELEKKQVDVFHILIFFPLADHFERWPQVPWSAVVGREGLPHFRTGGNEWSPSKGKERKEDVKK